MLVSIVAASILASCSAERKLSSIKKNSVAAGLRLGKESALPELVQDRHPERDTMKVQDLNGKEVLIMRAVRDDQTGEMVATEELRAAVVTARFRNVAERNGEVDLEFQVIVTDTLRDSKWQLRFYPKMMIMGDTVALDPVIITGEEFRRSQMRGYQQYDKFLQSIARDSLYFIDESQLEIFLERNLPGIFKFKNDTSFVSDEEFASVFGVTEKEAIEHYTNKYLVASNARKLGKRGKMFDRYVRNPISREGIRLDTVLRNDKGEFIYNYIQTIRTRPGLRKVDIILSGEIRDTKTRLYIIPPSDPLTFYISSLSSFVDDTERYRLIVVERRAAANAEFNIEFASGKAEIDPDLGKNYSELTAISKTLGCLLDNKVFDLDSIVVTASCSPEGKLSYNELLAGRRSRSVTGYFREYMRSFIDSLDRDRGFSIDEEGRIVKGEKTEAVDWKSRSIAENWKELDSLVRADSVLNHRQKEHYFAQAKKSPDAREASMMKQTYYPYLKTSLYPRLRTVKFDFFLHRKGMVKDTVHTTVLDSVYMSGVQAVKDRDFQKAIHILRPYNDFNTAVAYLAMDYNSSALSILEREQKTARVNYMLAILYSRIGEDRKAVQCYMHSCEQEPAYVHRGNLDPEISALIKRYNLFSYL